MSEEKKSESERMLERVHMEPDGAYAIVELVVEIKAESWGPDCSVGQAATQAVEDARKKLNNLINPPPGLKTNNHGVRLLGARCVRVICEAKRK